MTNIPGERQGNGFQPKRRLGRRLAIILLPLVLLPMVIMGAVAYLRAQSTLRHEAVGQMTFATQGQATTLDEWAASREQYLFVTTQRSTLQNHIVTLLENPEDPEAQASLQEELKVMSTQRGQKLFGEVALVERSSGEIIASTNSDHVGKTVQSIAESPPQDIQTTPIYDDQVLSPGSVAFITISPIRLEGEGGFNHYMIGVNSGAQVVQLLEDLQVFWQRQGIYRVERGKTFLVLSPDIVLELPRYATTLEAQSDTDHPVHSTETTSASGTLEYVNVEGEQVLGSYQWIPGWGMAVVVELPTSDIFAGIEDLAPFMGILIFVAVIVVLSAVIFTTNRMLNPLTTLADFANRISRGEWLYRVPEDREDELGALAASLNRMAEELGVLYQSLETRVEERTRQVRTASEVARAIISIPNLDDLLRQAVTLIKEQFGYDYVAIYLLDKEGRKAELCEYTGEIGDAREPEENIVEVGSATLIGWVTENIKPQVVSPDSDESGEYTDELLPGAQSEAAIPLQVAGNALGALDVQCASADAFKAEDLRVLQALADQLSAAIENARLAQVSTNAAERARIVSEITSQLSGLLEPEQVLHRAAQSLHHALGDAEIVVKLVQPEDETTSSDGNGR
ncbi:MAG: GAF domain-containing protein [Anaerolineales bacterium]|nr:GAF domain-containing protein [Anaerolineales bacterium]